MMHVTFSALDQKLAQELRRHLTDLPRVTVAVTSLLELETDVVVAPGNSFGFMDGGLDLQLTEHFGVHLQDQVQRRICDDWGGELPVGCTVTVPLPTGRHLVYAPTMRVPMVLPTDSVNPYLAMRAAMRACQSLPEVSTVGVPGLGTGVGRVPVEVFARQAAAALRDAAPPSDWWSAMREHQLLTGVVVRDLQRPPSERSQAIEAPGGYVVQDTVDPLGDLTRAILVETDGVLMAQLRTGDMAEVHQWTVEVPSAINLPVDELAHAFRGDGRNLLNFMSLLPDAESQRLRLDIQKAD